MNDSKEAVRILILAYAPPLPNSTISWQFAETGEQGRAMQQGWSHVDYPLPFRVRVLSAPGINLP